MVENVADDGVELKPAKIEASGEAFDVGVDSGVASGDVKPTKDVKFKVKIPFQAYIGHNQRKAKPVTLKKNLNRHLPVFVLLK